MPRDVSLAVLFAAIALVAIVLVSIGIEPPSLNAYIDPPLSHQGTERSLRAELSINESSEENRLVTTGKSVRAGTKNEERNFFLFEWACKVWLWLKSLFNSRPLNALPQSTATKTVSTEKVIEQMSNVKGPMSQNRPRPLPIEFKIEVPILEDTATSKYVAIENSLVMTPRDTNALVSSRDETPNGLPNIVVDPSSTTKGTTHEITAPSADSELVAPALKKTAANDAATMTSTTKNMLPDSGILTSTAGSEKLKKLLTDNEHSITSEKAVMSEFESANDPQPLHADSTLPSYRFQTFQPKSASTTDKKRPISMASTQSQLISAPDVTEVGAVSNKPLPKSAPHESEIPAIVQVPTHVEVQEDILLDEAFVQLQTIPGKENLEKWLPQFIHFCLQKSDNGQYWVTKNLLTLEGEDKMRLADYLAFGLQEQDTFKQMNALKVYRYFLNYAYKEKLTLEVFQSFLMGSNGKINGYFTSAVTRYQDFIKHLKPPQTVKTVVMIDVPKMRKVLGVPVGLDLQLYRSPDALIPNLINIYRSTDAVVAVKEWLPEYFAACQELNFQLDRIVEALFTSDKVNNGQLADYLRLGFQTDRGEIDFVIAYRLLSGLVRYALRTKLSVENFQALLKGTNGQLDIIFDRAVKSYILDLSMAQSAI
ncbi:RxLR-like protein [Plasmopara halstedii]|uniref:RxLR-like protein n=1 Tax=Plasmopara halstedii TaxID=4781 RepID=A0A0P1A7L8_PLAHL|nr:RxLR-like protein [Plasmopara halstedii]CEG36272.1 RxLR-like protein [Plasmopara halstedii]|eukprot:XP_024572641.1 RxLR-like protein [Plasmopara halstedii]